MVIVNNSGKRNVERMCSDISVSTLNHLSLHGTALLSDLF